MTIWTFHFFVVTEKSICRGKNTRLSSFWLTNGCSEQRSLLPGATLLHTKHISSNLLELYYVCSHHPASHPHNNHPSQNKYQGSAQFTLAQINPSQVLPRYLPLGTGRVEFCCFGYPQNIIRLGHRFPPASSMPFLGWVWKSWDGLKESHRSARSFLLSLCRTPYHHPPPPQGSTWLVILFSAGPLDRVPSKICYPPDTRYSVLSLSPTQCYSVCSTGNHSETSRWMQLFSIARTEEK